MADEPDNHTPPEAEAPEAQAPEAEAPEASVPAGAPEEDAPEAQAPEASVPAGAPEEDAPEAQAPEASVPAGAPDAEAHATEPVEAPGPAEAPAPAVAAREPDEQISPKERRRMARSKHAGQPRPPRSPQERHAERLLERRAKAVRRRARRLQERAKGGDRSKIGQGVAAPSSAALAPVHAPVEGKRRVRQGIVVSDKAEKTITVRIDVARPHRRYEKIVRSSSTLHAHDENNDAHEGDVVRVIESRPLSRTKRWKLIDVLERAR
jgi:small subunit ribosomal protein S17